MKMEEKDRERREDKNLFKKALTQERRREGM